MKKLLPFAIVATAILPSYAHENLDITVDIFSDSSLIFRYMDSINPGEDLSGYNLNDLQGQSVIKIDGVYHMYFAKHNGTQVHLATTEDLEVGPWIYVGVVLDKAVGAGLANFDHIAAPDVRIAEEAPGRYIMLFHGQHYMGADATDRSGQKEHMNFMAISDDPTDFNDGVLLQPRKDGLLAPVCISDGYARAFKMNDDYFAIASRGEMFDIPEVFETVSRTGTYDAVDVSTLSSRKETTNFTRVPFPISSAYFEDLWGLTTSGGDKSLPNYFSHLNHGFVHQIGTSNFVDYFFWLKKANDPTYREMFRLVLELDENNNWVHDPLNTPQAVIGLSDVTHGDGANARSFGDPFYFRDNGHEYLLFGYEYEQANSPGEGNIGLAKITRYYGDGSVWLDSDWDGQDNDADLDDDNDGIDDLTEEQFGLNPLNVDDAGADFDGDSQPNKTEILAGTDLNDASSQFRISSLVKDPVDGDIQIDWSAGSNRAFSIEYSENLVDWFPLPGASAITSGSGFTDTTVVEGQPRFYRVILNE
ncbi:MAG: hypothetical protein ACPGN3_01275 [Opitutales bacterium]